MSYLMGIDLGTSSAKTIIMDLHGNVVGIGQENYSVMTPCNGYAEQDAEELWEAAARSIQLALASSSIKPSDIKGIGLSGQMHGLVLLDKQMKPIRPAIIWADQRSQQQIDRIYNTIGRDELRSITLNSLSTGFFICSLLWVKEHEPQNYDNIHKAVLPKDYIRFKLCGELATDVTDGSSTLAFDTVGRRWSFELIEKLGIDTRIIPGLGEPDQIAGEISAECAAHTGLARKTPVVYGGGDSLMYAVGNGIIQPGIVSANLGTACQIAAAVNTPLYDRQFRTNTFCHVKHNLWIIQGGHLNGGIALKWLKDNYYPNHSYSDLSAMADEIPAGSEGQLFLPYLSGERTPYHDPLAKGILFGMTLRHGHNHMIRAVMEGVVLSMRLSLEILKELNIPIDKMVASGGGAKSKTWLQIQADIFNTEMYTVLGKEEACTGAAMVAGIGAGVYSTLEEACSMVVKYSPETTEPIPEHVQIYNEAFEKFRLLYTNNRNLF